MASPVSLATYNETWVTDNGIDNTSSSNNNVGIGSYDTMNNCWSYVSGNPSVASGTFDNGIGYAIKKDMVGTISFTGTLNTKDLNINWFEEPVHHQDFQAYQVLKNQDLIYV